MTYTMWRKRAEIWRSWLGFSQCVCGGAGGGHSKFRVIPQSPVQFVTDPACGAFDLVVSVEVWESLFYECLCQAQRLSSVRMEIWGLWLMSQSRPPEHGVRKEQFARKVWCATHAKPCLLTTQASWERLLPSWCHCFRRCLWSRPSSSLYSWTMTKDMDLLSLNSSHWDPELEKNVRGPHGHVCVINMWATHKHGSEQGRPVFFFP